MPVILLMILSCKKKNINDPIPNVTTNPVVFYFKGNIAGQSISIEAGINDYYMFTDCKYDSILSTYLFAGTFQQTSCSICKNVLRIKIIDDTLLSPAQPSHIGNLYVGIYNYSSPNDSSINSYTLKVFAVPTMSAYPVYQYSINNTYVANTPNFTNTLSPTPAVLELNYYDTIYACSSVLTNTLNLSSTDDFYSYYLYNINSFSQVVTFSVYANLPTSNSYTLDFGDGNQSVTTSTIVTHTYTNSNIYSAKLITKSDNGKMWTFQNNISTAFSNINCLGNYYYMLNASKSNNSFSKIIIEYIDENGVFYSSKLKIQPANYNFQINKIENYQNNINNQPTKKITASFSVRVFSSTNNYKDITGNVVFAVAYK